MRAYALGRIAVLVAVSVLVGCGDGSVDAPLDPAPVVQAAVLDGGGPIFRSIAIDLAGPAHVRAEYWADGVPRLRVESDISGSAHRIFLPRLHAAALYTYTVQSIGSDGELSTPVTGTFMTDSLPESLLRSAFSSSGQATFDLAVLEISHYDTLASRYSPVIVDSKGHIVWYDTTPSLSSTGFARLEDWFVISSSVGLEVVSPVTQSLLYTLGEQATADRLGVERFSIHHDVLATPQGTLLFLAQDTTLVEDTVWTGDAIWEWDPRSDALDKRWTAKDFLDPRTDRGARSVPSDWLHANSLAVGPRGNLVVSLYWLHEVLSIAPGLDAIEWRLGGPASTFQVLGNAMEAGQHTAVEVETDRILLFDNGLDRSDGLYSRAIELNLDRANNVAEVVWEFRPSPDIYAPILSSARRLANGNTVVGFGLPTGWGRPGSPDPLSIGPMAVFEVSPAGDPVWTLELEGVRFLYRATPITDVAGEVIVRDGS